MPKDPQVACDHEGLTSKLVCISELRHLQAESVGRNGRKSRIGKRPQVELPGFGRDCLILIQDGSSRRCEEITASSKAYRHALRDLPRVAPTDCTILITGEPGTGKELVARAIHEFSHRLPRGFVRVNCAAIPPSLMAHEFLGLREGSRSPGMQPHPGLFELAEGGTLFLEGIGELTVEGQIALLRCLQQIESGAAAGGAPIRAGVRLIASSDRDLRAAAADGAFLRDLYYRLNVFPIRIPALRDQKEDIPALVRYFMNHCAKTAGQSVRDLSAPSIEMLKSYPWPGNLRELQSVMELFQRLSESNGFSVDSKWIRWESHPAGDPFESKSGTFVLGEAQLLEAALMEMLAELPGWESPASGIEARNM